MSVKPISPSEVTQAKASLLPDGVLEAFNELIARNFTNGQSTFSQETVLAVIMGKMRVTSAQIFENRWLDVEEVYRKEGWDVKYDKPGWDEDYSARFIFRKKRG